MFRRAALSCLLLLICVTVPAQQPRKYTPEEVRRIHDSLLLIDSHNDVTSETVRGVNLANPGGKHTSVSKLRAGNVGATFFAVYVAAAYANKGQAAHRTLEMIDTVKRDIVAAHPNDFELATTAGQIEAIRKRGRMAALLGIEGGHAIEDSLRLLRTYHDLGVRYMTLTHSNNNSWADSSGAAPRHKGLTPFGRKVIAEMNRIGMLVDISHVSDATFYAVLEASKVPVFASHSSCRALSPIKRNMTDDMIIALAKKGGVIQINFGCEFVRQGNNAEAKVADVVAHIDHVRRIAGIDAIGIGSDYDGVDCVPTGLEDVSRFPNLTAALLERGYTPADVGKIYGGNLLRVMRRAEPRP